MFGFETNQQQINKLEVKINALDSEINGGIFDKGLLELTKELNEYVMNLRIRMSVLEEIVRESGLITDFDSDEIKVREDRKHGYSFHTPYQINKVKVEK